VLAASPIETARLLLMSEQPERRVGRGLVDHMVAGYLLLEPAPPPEPAGRGPFPGSALVESFVNLDEGTRRNFRGGFSIELAGPVPLQELGVERMVPSDQVDQSRATVLHAIGEVFADRCRYVELDPDKRDWLGRPVPRVHVGWTAEDRRRAKDMRTACKALADELAIPGSRLIPLVDPLLPGAGHEAGTCAMGQGQDSVCDAWGRLRALQNVWIADASVMPTAGDRHPTLTLLAHALRAADAAAVRVGRA
jgi:choline dehydrogenase-like flavoprotein